MVKDIRIGIMAPFYPAPNGLQGMERTRWLIDECVRLGVTVMDRPPMPESDSELSALGRRLDEAGLAVETSARGVFDLGREESRPAGIEALKRSVEQARTSGATVIRTGYGRLTLPTSRFWKQPAVSDHLAWYAECLKRAAEVIAGSGVRLGIENHCDFSGRQLAPLFGQLGSTDVGVALDTANGFTVFADANDDVEVLARYAVTTHIKDLAMIQNPGAGIPFLPIGCSLGQGAVDIDAAV